MQPFAKLLFVFAVIAVAVSQAKVAKPAPDAQAEPATRLERQAGGHHHDAVDFGAHTGHKGAFGWHADFPVHSHH
ncbi:uncharacterized protein LOC116178000 [Photinus pyralis]|uniref:uncharacterized protein LOC116178000 n=1 Tax=Photinus pyralis TaxID=7054 RepID=UPI001267174A|nr:uncharacterized protein LOC116178000 [Photinus pyralis]